MARLRELGVEVHQPTISWIESGKRPVKVDELVAIAQILRVPLEYLVLPWEDWLVYESETGYTPPTPSKKEEKEAA